MDFERLYIETFSQVRSSAEIDMEAFVATRKTAKLRRFLVIAAAVCVFAALCLTAYATDFLGLQSFIINRGSEPKEYYDFKAPTVEPPTVDNSDVLSLQGYADTPESLATLEWLSFYDSYDPGPLDNEPSPLWAEYGLYPVYDQTMADKLDEILEKYNLKKHSRMEILDYYELADAVGGEFYIGNDHLRNSGYIYEDGSFHTDADYLPPEGIVPYQMVRSVKGSFTSTALYIGDGSEYSQWQYECQGYKLTLALKDDHALVMADLGRAFVALNVLSGSETAFGEGYITVDKAMLEQLCDNLDWSVLANVITPDLDAVVGYKPEPEIEQPDIWDALPEEYAGYASVLRQAAAAWGDMTIYALYDLDGDGNEELLLQEGYSEADMMWSVLSPADATVGAIGSFPAAHGTLYPRAEGGLWLVQGMMGSETVSVITLEGGLVRQQIVSERQVNFAAGEEYTCPADKEIPTAYVNDLSLFNSGRFSGWQILDGKQYAVSGSVRLNKLVSGAEALRCMSGDITAPAEGMEYVYAEITVSYLGGDADTLYFYENYTSQPEYSLYFSMGDGEFGNAECVKGLVYMPVLNHDVPVGTSVTGGVVFLRHIGSADPIYFLGFGQAMRLDIR